jgi:hypothetical protein
MYSVSVTWYGQPGFRRTAGDSPILIDPFLTDRDDRCYPPPATATEFADVALVLCTPEPGSLLPRRDGLLYPELPITLSALAPDVLMLPINGRCRSWP